jgi:uncharacterized membrane protein YjgN (DUF898 family)
MKNYFKFNLTGNKLFPVWLVFIILYIIPYSIVQKHIQGLGTVQSGEGMTEVFQRIGTMFSWRVLSLLLFVVEYAILFFMYKMTIEGVEFKEKIFSFGGKFGEFISLFIGNLLLTIITLGIYSPWFMTRMYKFFASNATFDEHNFEFKGKGSDLFVIFLVALIIPMIFVWGIVVIGAFAGGFMKALVHYELPELSGLFIGFMLFVVVAIILIIICFSYYYYKWLVNLSHKGYDIKWETEFWPSAQQILVQTLLTIITLGIYSPVGSLRLYKYFLEKTVARNETSVKKFGYDLTAGDDFLFIWGQVLLCIITLGIYFPWAYCKISNYIFCKTYVEE